MKLIKTFLVIFGGLLIYPGGGAAEFFRDDFKFPFMESMAGILAEQKNTETEISHTPKMEEIWLEDLNLSISRCGWKKTQSCKSVEGNPLSVGGEKFERGVGTHAPGEIIIMVDPQGGKFCAKVGINDEAGTSGHAEFLVYGDSKLLWRSGFMTGGEKPKNCEVEFHGMKKIRLVVDTGPEGYGHDHTDWLNAKIYYRGKKPYTVSSDLIRIDEDGKIFDWTDENTCEWYSLKKQLKEGMKSEVKTQAFHPAATLMKNDRDPLDVVTRRIFPLIEYIRALKNGPALTEETEILNLLETKRQNTDVADVAARKTIFAEVTALRRKIMFQNPVLDFQKILFIKRHFNPEAEKQGNHMCDQFFGFHGQPGGGLFILENAFSENAEAKNILENSEVSQEEYTQKQYVGKFLDSKWAFLSPELSFDAQEILFAATDTSSPRHTYTWTDENTYHIFRCKIDGTKLVQLTEGLYNDFDPCYLPSGRIVFISERRGGYGRCHGRPVPCYTLYSMLPDGRDITQLSPHETNEWAPSVDHSGMVIYTRWDYVDRGFNQAHHPWITTPDGRDARVIQGNYDLKQNGRPHFETGIRAIPGSRKIMCTASCHHGQSYGSIIIVDPDIPDDGKMASVRRMTPDQLFPESEIGIHGPPVNYGTPFPLDEYTFLCVYDAFSRSDAGERNNYGLYLVDAFGNRTLLYRDPQISCYDPIPVKVRPVPPVVPHRTLVGKPLMPGEEYVPVNKNTLPKTARVGVINVYDSINSLPEGTKIQKLRIVQLLPKTTPCANHPRIGYGDEKGARRVLGTVPVEEDGSALFLLPVNIPVYFQAIDQNGLAIQSMRSATYVHPGEDLVCQGCHEFRHGAVGNTQKRLQTPLAMRREPSKILPGPEGSDPMNFPRLIQPILDKHCVECHETGVDGKKTFSLKRGPKHKHFFTSYENLREYTHYFNDRAWTEPKTLPLKFGTYASPLYKILKDTHYGVRLSSEEWERLTLWMDTNCDFYGAYDEMKPQREGKIIVLKSE
ncbi:MAG: NPCBM/NEW2 domain-containing protein [Planctomycetia bacterium]|nr:NPCBM/NEW2 domain-containing protein [Planctomycetia bacterium]